MSLNLCHEQVEAARQQLSEWQEVGDFQALEDGTWRSMRVEVSQSWFGVQGSGLKARMACSKKKCARRGNQIMIWASRFGTETWVEGSELGTWVSSPFNDSATANLEIPIPDAQIKNPRP